MLKIKPSTLFVSTLLSLLYSPLYAKVSNAEASPFNLNAFEFIVETDLNYRVSSANRFPTVFPPGSAVETVNNGDHLELSNIAFFTQWRLSKDWLVQTKIDFIDLYDRNPTSSDKKIDLDNFIIRYGKRHTQGALPKKTDAYAQFGKFGKFERQNDRHLKSYGLVSTAFNRLEDSGFEFGVDLTSGLYGKLSYTTGSPVYFRDPNLLAGDNGVFAEPDEEIKPGIPLLYDAEVEGLNLSKNPELGLGLGYRWINRARNNRINILLFNYQRELADTVELHGTVYGGDLDLLVVETTELPPGTITEDVGLPISGNNKKERGLNFWWYKNYLTVFAQYVDQSIAGLERNGSEIEISYALDFIPHIKKLTPVIRYSTLNADFVGPAAFPAPSVWWDWQKIDLGVNFELTKTLKLTLENSQTEFVRGGKTENNNEFVATLNWRVSF